MDTHFMYKCALPFSDIPVEAPDYGFIARPGLLLLELLAALGY